MAKQLSLKGMIDTRNLGNTCIFEGEHKTYGKVIVKIQTFDTQDKLMCLIREAFFQAKIRQQWVCEVLDFEVWTEKSSSKLYICTERLENNLSQEISSKKQKGQPYTEEELFSFLRGMVDALAEAQRLVSTIQKICHRDIKPENVFVSQSGQYKLGDFGEAKVTIDAPEEHSIRGTKAYMSPALQEADRERAGALTHNPYRSDVYSLGMTLLSMAALTHFDRFSAEEAHRVIPSLSYSEDLKSVIQCMLTFEESNRPDFIILKNICEGMKKPEVKLGELNALIDKIAKQVHLSTETIAQFGRRLEETWYCAFLNMLNVSISNSEEAPQFYVKKGNLSEVLAQFPLYSITNQLSSYPLEYIPISELVTNPQIFAPKSLIVLRKNTENQEIEAGRIESYTGLLPIYGKSDMPLFIVRKNYEIITVAEPAITSPSAMLKLDPEKAYIVTEGQFYRMGRIAIEIQSMNESRMSLCLISQSGERSSICLMSLEITIGTSPSSSFQLEKGIGVSRNHAVIRRLQQGEWAIQDLKSTNGTWRFLHTINSLDRESDEVWIEEGQQMSCHGEFFSFRS